MRTLESITRALTGLGLLMCMACPPDDYPPSATLLNHRNAPLKVTVRRLRVDRLDCSPYSVSEAKKLTRADFGEPGTLDLEAEDAADLALGACGAVWITLGHGFDHVITWDHLTGRVRTVDDETLQRSSFRHSVVVEGTRKKLVVTVGADLTALPPPGDGPAYLHALEDAGADASDAGTDASRDAAGT
jgi:hypothetical protein